MPIDTYTFEVTQVTTVTITEEDTAEFRKEFGKQPSMGQLRQMCLNKLLHKNAPAPFSTQVDLVSKRSVAKTLVKRGIGSY